MADLEEGELPSDDETVALETKQETNVESRVHPPMVPPFASAPTIQGRGIRGPVGGLSSSDDDSEHSDDGRYASRAKKKRVESMETGSYCFERNKSCPVAHPSRKVNNVWGMVLQEQTLSTAMIGLGVDKLDNTLQMDRDVESYDFTQAKLDTRPHCMNQVDPSQESHDPFDNVIASEQFGHKQRGTKRRRPVKERVGKKKSRALDIKTVNPKLDASEAEIVSDIVTELEEPNVELVGRVVRVLGKEKALELLKLTLEKEANGGILTLNQERRRTPGGVYIFLLKTDPDIKKDQVKSIFFEDICRNKKEYRSNQKKKLRRLRNQKKGQSFDISDDIKECLEKKAAEIRDKIKQEVEMTVKSEAVDEEEELEEGEMEETDTAVVKTEVVSEEQC